MPRLSRITDKLFVAFMLHMTLHRNGFLLALLLFSATFYCPKTLAQRSEGYGGFSSLSLLGSYSPTSEHLLVGHATDRTNEQAGIEYSRRLKKWSNAQLFYEGEVEPLYLEGDPTFIGESTPNTTGPPTVAYFPYPERPIDPNSPIGYYRPPITGDNQPLQPITGITGPRQETYAFAALPVGARLAFFTKKRIQLTWAIDLGALYGTRNIPVNYTSSFNFLAQTGPGLEIFVTKRRAVRLEYLYEHLSNADLGTENPGIDSLAFRITLSHYHSR